MSDAKYSYFFGYNFEWAFFAFSFIYPIQFWIYVSLQILTSNY
jgi:hypothetical protein